MNSYKCAENIIAGAGGYENITFIRHAGPVIIIGIRNNRIIQNGLIERNDMVRRCRLITDLVSLPPDRKCGELQVAMKPGDAAGIYNELCTLREYYELRDREEGVPRHNLEEDCKYLEKAGKIFADPDEDCGFTETCGDDGTDECDGERRPVQKGKYTAKYFMNAAEKAAGDLSLLHVEKNAVMGFVFMIAEEAARFANEKGLDDEFTLVPEFVSTLINAEEKDGRMEIGGNVFISGDKSACISVQYQKNGKRETYNLLVTDIEEKNRISYAGEINKSGDADEKESDGAAEVRKEGRNSGDGEKPAGTGVPNLSSLIMLIMMIVSLGVVMMIMQEEKNYATEHYQQEDAGAQYEPDSSAAAEEAPGGSSKKYTQEELLELEILSIAAVAIKIIGIIAVLVGMVGFAVYYDEKDKNGMSTSVKHFSTGILLLIMATVVSFAAPSIVAAM